MATEKKGCSFLNSSSLSSFVVSCTVEVSLLTSLEARDESVLVVSSIIFPASTLSIFCIMAIVNSGSFTIRNSSKAVPCSSCFASSSRATPGSSTIILLLPCLCIDGSATPYWSTLLRIISIARETASSASDFRLLIIVLSSSLTLPKYLLRRIPFSSKFLAKISTTGSSEREASACAELRASLKV